MRKLTARRYWLAAGCAAAVLVAAIVGGVDSRWGTTSTLPGLATPAQYTPDEPHDAAWLAAGIVPGVHTSWAPMGRASMRDLHHLTPAPPLFAGPAAGAGEDWGLTWPRDAAFSIVAMARTDHAPEALLGLTFLQRVQYPDGGFAARYQLNGKSPLDPRKDQLDGSGWVLWALDAVSQSADTMGRQRILRQYRQLLDRSTRFVIGSVSPVVGLPAPSPDYWERPERELTLGTAAPLLAGLQAATRLYEALGESARSVQVGAAARRLESAIASHFAPGGYQRYGDHGGVDAAVCFLTRPFVEFPDAESVAAAVRAYQATARRTAGGLAPGAGWRDDGISWTPETAMVALSAAYNDDRPTARRWLTWLDQHRVSWGSLPEKVRADGVPAGPAPLAWTSALVVLTLDALAPEPSHPPRLSADLINRSLDRIDQLGATPAL